MALERPAFLAGLTSSSADDWAATDRAAAEPGLGLGARPRAGSAALSDSALDDLVADPVLWPLQDWDGPIAVPVAPSESATMEPAAGVEPAGPSSMFSGRLAALGLAAGVYAGERALKARKRRAGGLSRDDRAFPTRSAR